MWDSDGEHFDEGVAAGPPPAADGTSRMPHGVNRNRSIQLYERVASIGQGTYGMVYECRERATGKAYAAKVLNIPSMRRADGGDSTFSTPATGGPPKLALREISNLLKVGSDAHHVLPAKEVVVNSLGTPIILCRRFDTDLHVVGQKLAANIAAADLSERCASGTLGFVKEISHSLLDAAAHMHSHGIMHRDVKPSNVLLSASGEVVMCDLGASRHIPSAEAADGAMTPASLRTTRSYRAPECLLGQQHYDESIDVWGVGCCAAEVWMQAPVLPQCGSDILAMTQLLRVVGWPPLPQEWPNTEGLKALELFAIDPQPPTLREMLSSTTKSSAGAEGRGAAVDFLSLLLTRSPYQRPSAGVALRHPFLQDPGIGGVYKQSLGDLVEALRCLPAAPGSYPHPGSAGEGMEEDCGGCGVPAAAAGGLFQGAGCYDGFGGLDVPVAGEVEGDAEDDGMGLVGRKALFWD